ncbi:putative integral membrane protein [Seiridium unicorne]|uniref:Integral membrane protein n=1 Tax=Seiridium unicorne TaxID=138068 RepID=A0ABR2VAS9_9PEZI
MPSDMAANGGLFFPMYQREALEINFSASRPFALKENEQTRQKRFKMLKDRKQIQDYMVVPGQTWLDGIMSEDGKFRQFIAKPKGSGFSVEAQATGEEKMGGMQIEIIPVKFEVPKKLDVRYKNMQEQSFKRTLALAEKGLGEESTLFDLKNLLRDEFEIAVEDQVLDADTSGLNISNNLNASEADAKSIKLGSLYFKPNLTLKLSHIKPQFGNLFQYGYDAARAASSAVLMGLEQEVFSEVTGLPPPPTPIDAKTYASYGFPFFESWGDEVPEQVHVIGQFQSTFRPVDALRKELEDLKLAD